MSVVAKYIIDIVLSKPTSQTQMAKVYYSYCIVLQKCAKLVHNRFEYNQPNSDMCSVVRLVTF